MCHTIFDGRWRKKPNPQRIRAYIYIWLANKLEIPVDECHFGYMDMDTLEKAYQVLLSTQPVKKKVVAKS